MHDDLTPACDHCSKFIFPFSAKSPMAEWGFCLDDCGQVPGAEELRELELAYERGDKAKLYTTKGLCDDIDQGCVNFEPR